MWEKYAPGKNEVGKNIIRGCSQGRKINTPGGMIRQEFWKRLSNSIKMRVLQFPLFYDLWYWMIIKKTCNVHVYFQMQTREQTSLIHHPLLVCQYKKVNTGFFTVLLQVWTQGHPFYTYSEKLNSFLSPSGLQPTTEGSYLRCKPILR